VNEKHKKQTKKNKNLNEQLQISYFVNEKHKKQTNTGTIKSHSHKVKTRV